MVLLFRLNQSLSLSLYTKSRVLIRLKSCWFRHLITSILYYQLNCRFQATNINDLTTCRAINIITAHEKK